MCFVGENAHKTSDRLQINFAQNYSMKKEKDTKRTQQSITYHNGNVLFNVRRETIAGCRFESKHTNRLQANHSGTNRIARLTYEVVVVVVYMASVKAAEGEIACMPAWDASRSVARTAEC